MLIRWSGLIWLFGLVGLAPRHDETPTASFVCEGSATPKMALGPFFHAISCFSLLSYMV
jgi:hypothetical protein